MPTFMTCVRNPGGFLVPRGNQRTLDFVFTKIEKRREKKTFTSDDAQQNCVSAVKCNDDDN